MIDMSQFTDAELLTLTGIVGYQEFQDAPEHSKTGLREKLRALTTLSDEEFILETESAIYTSALVGRLRGNWNYDHCYATACFHQSKLRKIAAGHLDECYAGSLYATAYGNVAVQNGMGTQNYPPCGCPGV